MKYCDTVLSLYRPSLNYNNIYFHEYVIHKYFYNREMTLYCEYTPTYSTCDIPCNI